MEEKIKALIMLTATVKPNSGIQKQWYTKTLNVEERRNQYISTILYYLSIEEIRALVFIDNGMYEFESSFVENISDIAKNLWKEIEFLTFQGDTQKQLKYTYGYGEFESLEYVYYHSHLFKKYKHLYKSTGRYRVYNIWKLIELSQNIPNLFYKYNIFNFSWLNTVFFKLSSEDILYLISQYDALFEKNSTSAIRCGAEEIIFQSLQGRELYTVKTYPLFMTLSPIKYLFYQLLCRLGYFDTQSLIFRVFAFFSTCIPTFVKVKFHKVLNFFMKWVQKKKK